MNKKQIAIRIAKTKGFDDAEFQTRWKEFDIYSAVIDSKDDDPPMVGLPVFILIDDSNIAHIATEREWSKFAGLLSE